MRMFFHIYKAGGHQRAVQTPWSGVTAESSVTLLLDRDVRPFTMSRQLNRAFGYYGLYCLLPNLSEQVTSPAAMLSQAQHRMIKQTSPDKDMNSSSTTASFTPGSRPGQAPPLNLGLRYHVPTYPRTRPSMMFLFVGSLLCYRLPPHKASRLCSCLSLIIAVL